MRPALSHRRRLAVFAGLLALAVAASGCTQLVILS
jgi:hypothetical protein